MDIKELQKEFLEVIVMFPVLNKEDEIEKNKTRALEVINELKDHINDDIEYLDRKMTALCYVISR